MYNGNYSGHLRNYSVLQNSFMLRASNFVSIKEKKTGIVHENSFQI
ncbi:hypothetical protein T01_7943 [Trichinella spiralis]|uniref:Uncharacterized protein n=1 Tax=Trichinella spiralis TaxID=6334 RepID=A0A0V0YSJ0_TRISP|nr:hypothetical protein T01_7943 [Trichinella spiralis]